MFKLSEIKDLIKLIDQTSIQEFEIENEGTRLLIKKPNKTESYLVAPAVNQAQYAQIPYGNAPSTAALHAEVNSEPAAPQVEEVSNLHKIVSPMVGTFYSSSSPEASPYVESGDKVKEKSVVCIVEAMKLMNEIEAEVKGEIVEVLVENGQLVEYGQPLFLVKPE